MEYFPAGDLFNYVQDYQSLSENDGREIASQIVSGLFLMHSEGYSHRDIKPHVSTAGKGAGLFNYYTHLTGTKRIS